MGTSSKLRICRCLGWKKEEKEGILSENPAEKKGKMKKVERKWGVSIWQEKENGEREGDGSGDGGGGVDEQ